MKLWQKGTAAEDWVNRFTVGEDYRWDTLLLPYDVDGTRAQAWALRQMDLLSEGELADVEASLDRLRARIERGEVVVRPEDEDAHTVIEHHLTEQLGETGKKIHTGRSRNDQVLVALRLFLRDALREIGRKTSTLAGALCTLGEASDHLLMPGYTHLQRAMPTTAGLWAMGYAELLAADLDGLRSAFDGIDVSPWGSAAGYGVPYLPMPRAEVSARLGFAGMQTHVTAVQLSRGKLELQAAHALAQIALSINRFASDVVLYTSAEFGFVRLPAEITTGSSIMPQKQNPDVFELARGMYHRLTAELHLLLTLPANLPSGYHRDLQLTKEAVMRSVLLTQDLLSAMLHAVPQLTFDEARMQAACTPELFATARALELVRDGVPFREAYRRAAAEVPSLAGRTPAEALAPYRAAGYPGHIAPEPVRSRLEAHRAWTTG